VPVGKLSTKSVYGFVKADSSEKYPILKILPDKEELKCLYQWLTKTGTLDSLNI
jgi:hypothetical protein